MNYPQNKKPLSGSEQGDDAHLEEYLAICKSVFEQMQRDGTWPWEDSPNSQDMVDSGHNPENL
jgi:hypothetical protein